MSLPSTAPCIALGRHDMPLVYAAEMIGEHTSCSSNDVFYHNMKHVWIHTRRHVMRRKPYLISESDHDTFPPVCEIFGNKAAEKPCVTEELRSTVLYYSDPLSSAKDVIKADGRFHDRCKLIRLREADDCEVGDQPICEFESNELCIEGKWCVCIVFFCNT